MREDGHLEYDIISSLLGAVGVVLRPQAKRPVRMLFLPRQDISPRERILSAFPEARPLSGKRGETGVRIEAFLAGEAVRFSIDELDFEGIGEFERRVLLADFSIPRGRVMAYGDLAAKAGVPRGARAVGNVMAGNPFPLIIPCHRVIRSDGTLGGFGGGLVMKKALLAMEGVSFDGRGRVLDGHCLRGLRAMQGGFPESS
ncbi:MAG: methylated-DNA--[protein]-cysteine S-methyltransferase [Thermodesulfobacteriota bacterium]